MFQLGEMVEQAVLSRYISFTAAKLRSSIRDAFQSEVVFSRIFAICCLAGLTAGVLILLACPRAGFCERFGENRNIIVVFRYDDYSSVSPDDCDLKVIDAFRRIGATVSFGAIPFVTTDYRKLLSTERLPENGAHVSQHGIIPLSQEKIHVRTDAVNESIVDVAMQGYSHRSSFSGQDPTPE
jgi:hypothetical protein